MWNIQPNTAQLVYPLSNLIFHLHIKKIFSSTFNLTHFRPLYHFFILWKRWKSRRFRRFASCRKGKLIFIFYLDVSLTFFKSHPYMSNVEAAYYSLFCLSKLHAVVLPWLALLGVAILIFCGFMWQTSFNTLHKTCSIFKI